MGGKYVLQLMGEQSFNDIHEGTGDSCHGNEAMAVASPCMAVNEILDQLMCPNSNLKAVNEIDSLMMIFAIHLTWGQTGLRLIQAELL